jgi:FMN phosphatase YigB (HAD superfamily)
LIFFDLDDTLLNHGEAARAGATSVFKVFRSDIQENLEEFLARWTRWPKSISNPTTPSNTRFGDNAE